MGIVGKSVYFLRLCVHLFYRLSVFLSFVLASLMLVAKLHSLSASASFTATRLSSKLPSYCHFSFVYTKSPYWCSNIHFSLLYLIFFKKPHKTEAILPYLKNILLLIYQVAERETVGEKQGRRIKRRKKRMGRRRRHRRRWGEWGGGNWGRCSVSRPWLVFIPLIWVWEHFCMRSAQLENVYSAAKYPRVKLQTLSLLEVFAAHIGPHQIFL